MQLDGLTDREVLALLANSMRELRARGLIRSSNNPIADYAEILVANQLGLELANRSTAGYDATGPDNVRYQIKARRHTRKNRSRQLGAIRNLEARGFDYLVVVFFDEVMRVMEI